MAPPSLSPTSKDGAVPSEQTEPLQTKTSHKSANSPSASVSTSLLSDKTDGANTPDDSRSSRDEDREKGSVSSQTPSSSRRQSEESVCFHSTASLENVTSLRISGYMSSDIPPSDLSRVSTQMSSTSSHSKRCAPVPLSDRRGLLAKLCLVSEVTEPHLYPARTKWLITAIVAAAASTAPMGTTIIVPTLKDIASDFDVSQTVTNLSVAFYMLSMSMFPLWWSSFSEKFGRRSIYLISFLLFTLFATVSALSTNIVMFVIMRALSGGAAASVQAVGAGSIADIWESQFRGRALGIFYLGPLCGPLIAPILGGIMTHTAGWRATQWFLAAFGAALTGMIVFALPETLRRREPLKKAREQHEENVDEQSVQTESRLDGQMRDLEKGEGVKTATTPRNGVEERRKSAQLAGTKRRSASTSNASGADSNSLRRVSTLQSLHAKGRKTASFVGQYLIEPLKIVLLLRFPPVLLTVMYASTSFGILYCLNISIVNTFSQPPYNWRTLIVGLAYIPSGIGFILASVLGGRWLDHILQRETKKAGRYDHKGKPIYLPEDRMRENVWIAASVFPVALAVYGWTAQYGVFWLVPFVCNFFFGLGAMLVFGTTLTMLTEFMPAYPSHGVALNNFVRNLFSCVGTLVAYPVLKELGNGKLMSILSGFVLVLGYGTIILMRKNSERWRKKYGAELGGSG